nr:MAG TPA: hypothetical protein [Caudoviricetes sp.]
MLNLIYVIVKSCFLKNYHLTEYRIRKMLYHILGNVISYVCDINVTNKKPPKRLIATCTCMLSTRTRERWS